MKTKTLTIEFLLKEAAEVSHVLDRATQELDDATDRYKQAQGDMKSADAQVHHAREKLIKLRAMLKEQGVEEWEMP
jgi:exonuclease VII small subunit